MKRKQFLAICMCAAMAFATPVAALAEEAETEAAAAAEEAADENQLSAPTDFTFDPMTGEYSFNATDENMGYYFIRLYKLEDGVEVGQYVSSSKRINGGFTGETTGTIDVSSMSWGSYHVNLVSFAPSGTDYTSPDPVTMTVQYGVDQTLERPELLAMTSGNQVELVVDWWTLCDYNFLQYMPNMQFTFYSDAECTEEVMSDTVDLGELVDTLSQNPPGVIYIWGWSQAEGLHWYTVSSEDGGNSSTFAFQYDLYTYTLDAGTYYVTAQALSKDEYTKDSQVSTVLEITLTDEEPTEEYTAVTTELWTDPELMDMPGANPGEQDRVDASAEQGVSAIVIE